MKLIAGILSFVLISTTSFAAEKETAKEKDRDDERIEALRRLSPRDREIMAQGPISNNMQIIGTVLSIYPGLGLGQLVQGRWMETGWIVTAGEIGSALVFVNGAYDCFSSSYYDDNYYYDDDDSSGCGTMTLGMIGIIGFRIYGIIDAIQGPNRHNARYYEIQNLVSKNEFMFSPIPMANNSVGLGLAMTF